MAASKMCIKCGLTLDEKNFYTYRSGEKFETCKKCTTMHIDYYDPETFTWVLKKLDIPFVPMEWKKVRDETIAKNPTKLDGIMGKYIRKLKLNQYKTMRWDDTERLAKEEEIKAQEYERKQNELIETAKQQLADGIITEAEYLTTVNTVKKPTAEDGQKELEAAVGAFYNEKDYMKEEEMVDLSQELTQEDKMQLAMKWGRFYKGSEWVELERNYNEMTNSFDIADADTENTLILICKTNLKMNQALDTGDIDTYQKLSRVSTDLRKSAKFTAAQNKESKDDYVDAAGQIVAYCEEHGGAIPKFKIEYDLDIVDKIIRDQKEYLKSLVYEDKALAQQIEDYIKKRQILDEKTKEEEEEARTGIKRTLTDKDIIEHKEMLAALKEQDNLTLRGGGADES